MNLCLGNPEHALNQSDLSIFYCQHLLNGSISDYRLLDVDRIPREEQADPVI